MGSSFCENGMPLSFEPFPLLLKAARIVGVEFSTGFQRPPVGRFVLLPLVAGLGCYGNEDPRCDGVGKVRPVFLARCARM